VAKILSTCSEVGKNNPDLRLFTMICVKRNITGN
jgi:hypothetical protein